MLTKFMNWSVVLALLCRGAARGAAPLRGLAGRWTLLSPAELFQKPSRPLLSSARRASAFRRTVSPSAGALERPPRILSASAVRSSRFDRESRADPPELGRKG